MTSGMFPAAQLATITDNGNSNYCDSTLDASHQFRIMSDTNGPGTDSLLGRDPLTNYALPYTPQTLDTAFHTSIRLGNCQTEQHAEALYYTMNVRPQNALLSLYYAMVDQSPSHGACCNGVFVIRIARRNSSYQWEQINDTLCYFDDHTHVFNDSNGWHNPSGSFIFYRDWCKATVDLSPYLYEQIRVEVYVSDCQLYGHYGYCYFAGECQPMEIHASGCSSGTAQILTAPSGLDNYVWYKSNIDGHLITNLNNADSINFTRLTPLVSTNNTYTCQPEDFRITEGAGAGSLTGNMVFRCDMTTSMDSTKPVVSKAYVRVNSVAYTTERATALRSYTWHGRTLTRSGVYSDTLTTVAGCDSIITLYLTVENTLYCPGLKNPASFTSGATSGSYIGYYSGQTGNRLNQIPDPLTGTTGVSMTSSIIPASQLATTTDNGSSSYCDSTLDASHQFRIMFDTDGPGTDSLLGRDPLTNYALPYTPQTLDSSFHTSIRLGNCQVGQHAEALYYTMNVRPQNTLLSLYYSIVINNPNHVSAYNQIFVIRIARKNSSNQWVYNDTLCYTMDNSAFANGSNGWHSYGNSSGGFYRDWHKATVNLFPYLYEQIRVEVYVSDCQFSGHYGYCYFAGECQPMQIQSFGCSSDTAQILTAPSGLDNYVWYKSNIDGRLISNLNNVSDSINFTRLTPLVSTINTYICQPEDFRITEGADSGSLTNNMVFRCDMTTSVDPTKPVVSKAYVRVSNEVHSSERQTAILSYTWHGRTFTRSGVYTDTLTTLAGCDSIVTLYLTVEDTVNTCPGFHNPLHFDPVAGGIGRWSARVGERVWLSTSDTTTGYNVMSTCADTNCPDILGDSNITSTLYNSGAYYDMGINCCHHDSLWDANDRRFQIITSTNAGYDEFTINGSNGMQRIPTGHTTSIRLGDPRASGVSQHTHTWSSGVNKGSEALFYTMRVNPQNALLFLDYSVVARAYNHSPHEASEFLVRMVKKDASGLWSNVPINDSMWFKVSAPSIPYSGELPAPWIQGRPGSACQATTCAYIYTPWTRMSISLADYMYDSVRVEVYTSDCIYDVDPLYAYIAGNCRPVTITSSGCPAGTSNAVDTLTAPEGLLSYTWYISTTGYNGSMTNLDSIPFRQVQAPSPNNVYVARPDDFIVTEGPNMGDTVGTQTYKCVMTSAMDPSKPIATSVYTMVQNTKPRMVINTLTDCDGNVHLTNRSVVSGSANGCDTSLSQWWFYSGADTTTALVGSAVGGTAYHHYDDEGIYAVTVRSFNADNPSCYTDSILHLSISLSRHSTEWDTTTTSYTWHGMTLTEPGTYADTVALSNGCDSIVTLHLAIVHNVEVSSANPDMGTASGTGVYPQGDTIMIEATAAEHYHFVQWDDGNTDNPRSVVVTASATYVAYFEIDHFHVTATSNDITMGIVSGGGTYDYGTQATLTASPNSGFEFRHWSNGVTYNPFTFTVVGDVELMGIFVQEGVGIDGADGSQAVILHPNPTSGTVTIEAEGLLLVEAFDATGRKVIENNVLRTKNRPNTATNSLIIDLSILPAGTYTFRITTITGVTTRRVLKK